MDESSFDIDSDRLSEMLTRFPARRHWPRYGGPSQHTDLAYLARPDAEFARHAWDEGGHS